jgi:UDP-3-O-[3-hydroxymyristoyl] glucosamine N-acyltransferase
VSHRGDPPAHTGSGEGDIPLTASGIAALVGGTLVGDPLAAVTGVAALDRAGPSDASFYASGKYADAMEATRAAVVLVAPELAEAPCGAPARVVVHEPHEAMLVVVARLHPSIPEPAGVHSTARLGRGVVLGEGVRVGPYAVIEDGAILGDRVHVGTHCLVGRGVRVGDDSRLVAHVTLHPGAELGRRVFVQAGARIASDGFGYVFRDGEHRKLPHVGRAVLEDDVEVGANVTIDRGSIDDTVIGAGTKIDNLVQIGHNVRIGRKCLLMSQVGIAGSARIGDGVILAGQAGIGGHLTIGAGARVAGQSGVFGDIPAGESWSGYPARPHRESLRASAALFRLAGLIKRLERLVEERDR